MAPTIACALARFKKHFIFLSVVVEKSRGGVGGFFPVGLRRPQRRRTKLRRTAIDRLAKELDRDLARHRAFSWVLLRPLDRRYAFPVPSSFLPLGIFPANPIG